VVPAAAVTPVAVAPVTPAPSAPWSATLPKDSLLDAGFVTGLQDLAKTKGIPGEHAQAFAEFGHAQALAMIEQAKTERAQWDAELSSDPAIGSRLAEVKSTALAAADNLFGPQAAAFKALLTQTGYGNHPVIVRALAHAATLMRSDSIAGAQGGTGSAPTEDQQLRQRYPLMYSA
jgi:hypothetical protein